MNRREGAMVGYFRINLLMDINPKRNGGTNDPGWDGQNLIQMDLLRVEDSFYNVFGVDICNTAALL